MYCYCQRVFVIYNAFRPCLGCCCRCVCPPACVQPFKHYPVLNWLCACVCVSVFVIKPPANMQSWIYTSALVFYTHTHTEFRWIHGPCAHLWMKDFVFSYSSAECMLGTSPGTAQWRENTHERSPHCKRCFLVFKPSECVFVWGSDQISGVKLSDSVIFVRWQITSEMFEQLMDKVYKVWVWRFSR